MPVKSSALSVYGRVSRVPLHNTDGAITVRADFVLLRLNKQPLRPTNRGHAWPQLLIFPCSSMTGWKPMRTAPVGKELSSDLPLRAAASLAESNLPKDSHVLSCSRWACDTGTGQNERETPIYKEPGKHTEKPITCQISSALTARRPGTNLVLEAIMNLS